MSLLEPENAVGTILIWEIPFESNSYANDFLSVFEQLTTFFVTSTVIEKKKMCCYLNILSTVLYLWECQAMNQNKSRIFNKNWSRLDTFFWNLITLFALLIIAMCIVSLNWVVDCHVEIFSILDSKHTNCTCKSNRNKSCN